MLPENLLYSPCWNFRHLEHGQAFERYIYGYAHNWERNADGTLIIHPRKIGSHRWVLKQSNQGFLNSHMRRMVSSQYFGVA
jgi:hypothetical protein